MTFSPKYNENDQQEDDFILPPLHAIQEMLLFCYYAGEIENMVWQQYLREHPALAAYCPKFPAGETPSAEEEADDPPSGP